MQRTLATIIGDIILAAGEIDTLRAGWVIPVERAGWDCNVTVSASIWKHAIEIDGSYVVFNRTPASSGKGR